MTTPLTAQQRVLAVALVAAASMVAFEVTASLTALPTIADQLHGDASYGLSMAAYTLANLVAMVAVGEALDRRGPALPFLACIATFTLGLVVSAASGSMAWFITGRVLQGAGSGGLAPVAYSQVRRSFPEDHQPKMYAWLSAAWVLPSLFAPGLAGLVTETVGWRWVFLGLAPGVLAVGAMAVRPLARDPGPANPLGRSGRIPLAFVAAAGIGLLVAALQSGSWWFAIAGTLAGVAAGFPALGRLFPRGVATAARGLPAVLTCRILATMCFGGVDGFVPLAADRIHHARPLVQGFVIIGAALTWSLGQWWRAHHAGVAPARAVGEGFVLLAFGVVLTAPVVWAWWPLWAVFLGWAVGGLGMGLLFNPTSVAAMGHSVNGSEGLVSSQLNLADSVGWSLIGGIGGATIAIADRGAMPFDSALLINFAMATACGLAGLVAARHVSTAPR